MSLLQEDSVGTNATTPLPAIDATSTQHNTLEERRIENKAQQDSNAPARDSICAACNDRFPLQRFLQVPCQHLYCSDCLERLFGLCMEDENLYPPRCCKQIMPWSEVKALVPRELANAFEAKREELETQDRTYCSDPACGTFVGSRHMAVDTSTATCPACEKLTCVTCKNSTHPGDCPEDPSLQPTLDVAKEEGWQRCQECGRMIDRIWGCNHISCPCGHHFCYSCGQRWNTCDCEPLDDGPYADLLQLPLVDPYADLIQLPLVADNPAQAAMREDMVARGFEEVILRFEDRLRRRAARANLDAGLAANANQPPGPQNVLRDYLAHAVDAAHAPAYHPQVPREELQLEHRDRNHDGWHFVHGAGVCAHCGEDMPVFLMECATCRMQACRWCMQNRL